MMMKSKILQIALILSSISSVFAETNTGMSSKEEYRLDSRYRAGEYLIYDCRFQYYACVNKDSFDQCKDLRERDKVNKLPKFSCANIGKFESKEKCILKEYEVQDRNIPKKFCIN